MYSKNEILEVYNSKLPNYNRADNLIKDSLSILLKSKGIPYLIIASRVKEFESFFEKINQKKYQDPFIDNEDFCGARIILYYPNETEKTIQLIRDEFDVQTQEDKGLKLEPNEFGYRSFHLIVKFKKEWLSTPNYRGLDDVKIEIQIRTVLMHAWAEIEHKLGYKNHNQVPRIFTRKLSIISAKLEEADEQFQSLKNEIEKYKNEIISESSKKGIFTATEMNLESFKALLDYYFNSYEKDDDGISAFFTNIQTLGLSLNQLSKFALDISPHVDELISKINSKRGATQTNLMAYAIETFYHSQDYVNAHSSKRRAQIVLELKKLLGVEN